jgi:hypothetical protein
MNKYLNKAIDLLKEITEWLKVLFVFGVLAGLLFNDPFNILSNISVILNQFGDDGAAAIVALLVILVWNKNK